MARRPYRYKFAISLWPSAVCCAMHPFVVPAIVSCLLTILVLHWVPRLYIKRVDRIRQAAATVVVLSGSVCLRVAPIRLRQRQSQRQRPKK